jgi:hypothetical protein
MPDATPPDDDLDALLSQDDVLEAERKARAEARRQEEERERLPGVRHLAVREAVEDILRDLGGCLIRSEDDWRRLQRSGSKVDWERHLPRLAHALVAACRTWRDAGYPESLFDRELPPGRGPQEEYALRVLRRAMRGADEGQVRELLERAVQREKHDVWQCFRDLPPPLLWPPSSPPEQTSRAPTVGECHPAPGAWQGEGTDEESELTDRQEMILETMLEHGIMSERRRETRADIVRLINRTHKAPTYARDFAALVKRGYLRSLEGPSGGYWLTPTGEAEARRLRLSN